LFSIQRARELVMGRHGKNATASAVYSYHEKKKDTGMDILNHYTLGP